MNLSLGISYHFAERSWCNVEEYHAHRSSLNRARWTWRGRRCASSSGEDGRARGIQKNWEAQPIPIGEGSEAEITRDLQSFSVTIVADGVNRLFRLRLPTFLSWQSQHRSPPWDRLQGARQNNRKFVLFKQRNFLASNRFQPDDYEIFTEWNIPGRSD